MGASGNGVLSLYDHSSQRMEADGHTESLLLLYNLFNVLYSTPLLLISFSLVNQKRKPMKSVYCLDKMAT
jgi:hypothetical protein